MIKNKLFKGVPFLLALGLIAIPVTNAFAAEPMLISANVSAEDMLIDDAFMIKPEVFVNNKEIKSDSIKILNNAAYLPLEEITYNMGDILTGTSDTSYMLRKGSMLLKIMPSENKYIVNGTTKEMKFEIVDGVTYAPLDLFLNVLDYTVQYNGNSIYFGEVSDNSLNGDSVHDAGHLLDNMAVNPEVYISGERYPDFALQIRNGQVYLPIEVVCEKMGERLEGDIEAEYYLRNNNMMLVIDNNNSKYYVNQKEYASDFFVANGNLYVPMNFIKDVLKYDVKEDGNSIYVGQIKAEEKLPDTYANGSWNLADGTWYYSNNGQKVTGWVRSNNSWYYLDNSGAMQKGWLNLNNTWYFLNNDGTMATGWLLNNDNYYYLNNNGAMAQNTIVDGVHIAQNGVAISLY